MVLSVSTRGTRPNADDDSAPVDAAFDALFRREYEGMIRLAFVMLASQEQAEDVVHDAMSKVFERWSRIDNPGGYLRVAVVNGARSVLRRRRFVRQSQREVEAVDPKVEYVADLLASLSPTRRAVVTLRYFEQRTVPEIADLLGMREGTVKSALHRSLRALREELSP